MKNVTELREALNAIIERENRISRALVYDQAPRDLTGETLEAYQKAMDCVNEVIHNSLKRDMLYSVPNDDFYPALMQLMTFKLYATYDGYKIEPEISDEQILAHSDVIEEGCFHKLGEWCNLKLDKSWAAPFGDAFYKLQALYNNLAYYFYVMAHLAKHYGTREAAHKYLRAHSIASKAKRMLPLNISEDAVNELFAISQEAADELKVAADYYNLKDWEIFRADQAEKLAAEDAKVQESQK